MNARTLICAVSCTFFTSTSTFFGVHDAYAGNIHATQSTVYLSQWFQDNVTLQVKVSDGTITKHANGKDVALPDRNLSICKLTENHTSEKIFSYDTMDNLLSVFVVTEDNSNLFTVWVTGSAVRFLVYSYQEGKIINVLDVGSKIIPEVIHMKNGDDAVIVSNIDWVDDKDGKSKMDYTSADIYKWDGHRYKLSKTVPWTERLDAVEN